MIVSHCWNGSKCADLERSDFRRRPTGIAACCAPQYFGIYWRGAVVQAVHRSNPCPISPRKKPRRSRSTHQRKRNRSSSRRSTRTTPRPSSSIEDGRGDLVGLDFRTRSLRLHGISCVQNTSQSSGIALTLVFIVVIEDHLRELSWKIGYLPGKFVKLRFAVVVVEALR
jgi:hypothetical protein